MGEHAMGHQAGRRLGPEERQAGKPARGKRDIGGETRRDETSWAGKAWQQSVSRLLRLGVCIGGRASEQVDPAGGPTERVGRESRRAEWAGGQSGQAGRVGRRAEWAGGQRERAGRESGRAERAGGQRERAGREIGRAEQRCC